MAWLLMGGYQDSRSNKDKLIHEAFMEIQQKLTDKDVTIKKESLLNKT